MFEKLGIKPFKVIVEDPETGKAIKVKSNELLPYPYKRDSEE